MGREEGGGFRVEGTHVYLWPIHIDVWKQLSQYCSYLPIKINTFKKINKITCTEIASLMLIGIYFSTIEFILQSSHILDTTIAKI